MENIAEIPVIAQEDRNNPPCLTVFLFFCTNKRLKEEFRRRVKILYGNERTVCFLDIVNDVIIVSENSVELDAENFMNIMNDYHIKADLNDAINLNLCPVIALDNNELKYDIKMQIIPMLLRINVIVKHNSLNPLWIPFCVVNNTINFEIFKDSFKEMVQQLGADYRCCKVCLFSNISGMGDGVSDTSVANVAILTTFLYACFPTIMTRVLYRPGEQVLYTSSVALILQYLTKPILQGIVSTIDTMIEVADENSDKTFEIKFINGIVSQLYKGMPRNKNGEISMSPLYGVMLGNDNVQENLEKRLEVFCKNNYIKCYEENKIGAFKELHEKFFEEFKRKQQPIAFLRGLIQGDLKLNIPKPGIKIAELPKLPKKNLESYTEANSEVAKRLNTKLMGLGVDFFAEYINSKQFTTVLDTYNLILAQLENIKDTLLDEIKARNETEILKVVSPDVSTVFKNYECRELLHNTVENVLNGGNVEDSIENLLDGILSQYAENTKKIRGNYLKMLADNCTTSGGTTTQTFVKAINEKLYFPTLKSQTIPECVLVWGRRDNNFLKMWESLTHVDTEYTNHAPSGHIVMLSISTSLDNIQLEGVDS